MENKQPDKIHYAPLRVEFEDCAAMGVVYHPNYLRFIERSRVDFLRQHRFPFKALMNSGFAMVISEINAKYWRPARFEDQLHVYTRQVLFSEKQVSIEQIIVRDLLSPADQILPARKIAGRIFVGMVHLTSIDLSTMRSTPFPSSTAEILSSLTVKICED